MTPRCANMENKGKRLYTRKRRSTHSGKQKQELTTVVKTEKCWRQRLHTVFHVPPHRKCRADSNDSERKVGTVQGEIIVDTFYRKWRPPKISALMNFFKICSKHPLVPRQLLTGLNENISFFKELTSVQGTNEGLIFRIKILRDFLLRNLPTSS